MAHLVFDNDESRQLRDSAREHADAGDTLLAYVLENMASEGIDLDKLTPYEDIRARHGLDSDGQQHASGAA
ncbi:hypothetical protein [Streptomyces sp. H27-C3]|uniref:hypothetical protein n=1 Tax=Streptomyces sp. H27-C3 TaxID=3046305 RepID=UPI0024BB62ED|nr:hypothetical protein [Streptomyces sp. H27-C3]MDJ0466801.1 hypothetical protein [Streptomyces sp. H27-C3]